MHSVYTFWTNNTSQQINKGKSCIQINAITYNEKCGQKFPKKTNQLQEITKGSYLLLIMINDS